ncbi:MAG: hypothetical protein ABT940_13340, partial [Alphaproteobacteria bacterium]
MLAALAILLWPASAHAIDFFTFEGTVTQFILAVINSFLSGVVGLIGQLMMWLLRLLTPIILNPTANYGGIAVYTVWKLFRDLCNSFFIVFFIVISFSTIFHTVWKAGHAYYYRPALLNVIVAAILVNFSLPIGQTIVWGGNQAALAVGGLIQGVNLENRLIIALKLKQRKENLPPALAVYTVPDTVTPRNQQGVVQGAFTDAYTSQVQAEYFKCKGNPAMENQDGGCYGLFSRMYGDEVMRKIDQLAVTKAHVVNGAWGAIKFAARSAAPDASRAVELLWTFAKSIESWYNYSQRSVAELVTEAFIS